MENNSSSTFEENEELLKEQRELIRGADGEERTRAIEDYKILSEIHNEELEKVNVKDERKKTILDWGLKILLTIIEVGAPLYVYVSESQKNREWEDEEHHIPSKNMREHRNKLNPFR